MQLIPFEYWLKPISPTNAHPRHWFYYILAASTLSWILALTIMFASLSTDDAYEVVDTNNKLRRGIGKASAGVGTAVPDMLDNLTIGTGSVGLSAL